MIAVQRPAHPLTVRAAHRWRMPRMTSTHQHKGAMLKSVGCGRKPWNSLLRKMEGMSGALWQRLGNQGGVEQQLEAAARQRRFLGKGNERSFGARGDSYRYI
ncbi:hypothetical protein ZWY2020_058394 [Hordeum vulgare]|nr:hypothetical protein ZWY2020_058394 [Hordeum vulgare]